MPSGAGPSACYQPPSAHAAVAGAAKWCELVPVVACLVNIHRAVLQRLANAPCGSEAAGPKRRDEPELARVCDGDSLGNRCHLEGSRVLAPRVRFRQRPRPNWLSNINVIAFNPCSEPSKTS